MPVLAPLSNFHCPMHTGTLLNNISVICPAIPGGSRNTAVTTAVRELMQFSSGGIEGRGRAGDEIRGAKAIEQTKDTIGQQKRAGEIG
jgi:hypothetical protein